MAIFRIFVATAIVAALATPATAGAARRAPHSSQAQNPVEAALAVGQRYWGATPCNGQIDLAVRSPLASGMDPTTDAWVTFASTRGANNLAAPAAGYRSCVIALARWRWPTAASMTQDWEILCTTMVHEMGHLLGHPHDNRRGSVMAPVFTDASSVPSMCRKTRLRATSR